MARPEVLNASGKERTPILAPQAAGLAGGLDDPGQHALTEHLVAAGRVLEPQYPVGVRASSR